MRRVNHANLAPEQLQHHSESMSSLQRNVVIGLLDGGKLARVESSDLLALVLPVWRWRREMQVLRLHGGERCSVLRPHDPENGLDAGPHAANPPSSSSVADAVSADRHSSSPPPRRAVHPRRQAVEGGLGEGQAARRPAADRERPTSTSSSASRSSWGPNDCRCCRSGARRASSHYPACTSVQRARAPCPSCAAGWSNSVEVALHAARLHRILIQQPACCASTFAMA